MTSRRLAVIRGHLESPPAGSLSLSPVCGIIAYVGDQEAAPILLQGLRILESRGYDSAGLSTVSAASALHTSKFASSAADAADALSLLSAHVPAHAGDTIGVGHTRWATHGGRTDANAHPHLDAASRVAIVHNGIIDNASALRAELEACGVAFRSQTDSEVVAQLLGQQLAAGAPMERAFPAALARLEGTWGLVALDRLDPARLFAARNGSPLLVGCGQGEAFVASEAAAFLRYTKNFIALDDGEWCEVSRAGGALDRARLQRADAAPPAGSPAPFAHWTRREMAEQPDALTRALKAGGRLLNSSAVVLGGLNAHAGELAAARHVVLLGCGSSLYAAQWGARLLRRLGGVDSARALDAAEATPDALPPRGGAVCAISQSGETKDVHRALVMAMGAGLPAFAVVNAVGSLIARTAACGVYLHAGREHAVASTKSFSSQCAVLALVALWFAQVRHEERTRGARAAVVAALHALPAAFAAALAGDAPRRVAAAVIARGKASMFVLGRGMAQPVALEGALKVKEMAYLHAEGLAAGALKHGPLALVEDGTPVVAVVLDDENLPLMLAAAEEVRARGGVVYAVTNCPHALPAGLFADAMPVPPAGPLSSLVAVVPLQLLAYELSVALGRNPDRPRNLAKSVTVV